MSGARREPRGAPGPDTTAIGAVLVTERSPDPTAHRSTGNRPLSRRCCRSADGGLLEDLLTAAATEPDAEPVAVRLCGWREHTRLLRTGEADAALMFAPYDPDRR